MFGQTATWNTNNSVKKEGMHTKCLYLRIFAYTYKYVSIGSRSLSLYISFDIVVHACVWRWYRRIGGVDGVEGAKVLSLRLHAERAVAGVGVREGRRLHVRSY